MTLELRRRLDQIDKWLCDPIDGEALNLILAAIRGPDLVVREEVKDSTTNVIRRTAFPKVFEIARSHQTVGGASCWYVAHTADTYDTTVACLGGGHFEEHTRQAARALGLWPKL